MIEKLEKEFQKIRASLTKSKKLIVADIDKIDEKYRKLAQEEKRSLTESLAVLNEQLKYYDKMLNGEPIADENVDADATEETPEVEEKEAVIEDTIFPENNESEEGEKQEEKSADSDTEENTGAEETEPEKEGLTKEEIVEKLESAGFVNIDEVVNQEEAPAQIDVDANGWPIPDDWK